MRYSSNGNGMRGVGSVVQRSARYSNNEKDSNVTTSTRPPQTRVALVTKDRNALIQTPQKPAKRGIIMPPPEKHNDRPLMSSAPKAPARPPLTPRIAGSTSTTPSLRKAPRSEVNGTPYTVQKDEYTPPGVTPRSNSRRTRIESPNSTPSSTPTPGASAPRLADPPRGFGAEDALRPSVTFSPASEFIKDRQNANSKFFYASDAKGPAPPQRPIPHTASSSFLYANGKSIPPVIKSNSSAVGSSVGEDRLSPMFFHANGAPDIPTRSHSPTGSNLSASRVSSRLTAHKSSQQPPVSPQKVPSRSSIVSARSNPTPTSSPLPPRPNTAAARGKSAQSIAASRRVSLEPQQNGRPFSAAGGFDFTSSAGKVPRSPEASPPASPTTFSSLGTVSTLGGEGDEKAQDRDAEGHSLGSPMRARSPVRVGGSLEQMNELAAEARRNRKVLDLEITNSSLEAINRTLERQMRKQTAELRRYRRLSRSGRLSLADSTPGRNSHAMDGADLSDMSDMSEDGDEGDEDGEEHTSEEESVDDGSMSPGAIAESDARHRSRDEKRFRVELSKHQQLIADSVGMNSSLRRCIAWTEELIEEGQKALAYSVRPCDVNIGGRVLISEDIEIDESEGLSEIGAKLVREARRKRGASLSPSSSSFGGSNTGDAWVDRNDRDSGIELPANYRPDPRSCDGSKTHMELLLPP